MFAYVFMFVSGCLSNILARTHACVHTHVEREYRLDVGVREQERGIGSSADGAD